MTGAASQHRHDIEFPQPVTMSDASQALTATTAFFSLLTDATDMPRSLPAASAIANPPVPLAGRTQRMELSWAKSWAPTHDAA
jgi:hypothetical protein